MTAGEVVPIVVLGGALVALLARRNPISDRNPGRRGTPRDRDQAK